MRQPVQRHLVANCSKSIVIRLIAMILSIQHFRSHITWRPLHILKVFFSIFPSYPKVSDLNVPIPIEHQVLRLDILVDYAILMYIFQSNRQAANYELDLLLTKLTYLCMIVSQVTSTHKITDKVDILSVLESVLHVDQKRVM